MISVVGFCTLWWHRWMALDRLSFLGVDGRWSCVFVGFCWKLCLCVCWTWRACGVCCRGQQNQHVCGSVYMQSARATLDVKGTMKLSEYKSLTLYSHVCFTHTVQPCVFYSHCTAMCVFYWVSVRDDDISLGRACDWIDSSADCLTDLFLSTVYINITIMITMFTYSLFESFLAANFFFLILAVLVSVCLYGTH